MLKNKFQHVLKSVMHFENYVSRLRGDLQFGCGVARNSGKSRITSQRTGSAKPYLVVNRIYFIWAGQAHHTNKVGVLVPAYFPSYFSAQQ